MRALYLAVLLGSFVLNLSIPAAAQSTQQVLRAAGYFLLGAAELADDGGRHYDRRPSHHRAHTAYEICRGYYGPEPYESTAARAWRRAMRDCIRDVDRELQARRYEYRRGYERYDPYREYHEMQEFARDQRDELLGRRHRHSRRCRH